MSTVVSDPTLEQKCIETIRFLAVDGVQKANSGHPGMPMGAAAIAYTLLTRHLRYDPADPRLAEPRPLRPLRRPRLDAPLLACSTSPATTSRSTTSRRFRQWGSRTPGHPEFGHTAGVETTTGPLGQGIANAVGMAMAERILAATLQPRRPRSSTTTPTCSPATAT